MKTRDIARRSLLKDGAAALAGLTVLRVAGPTQLLGRLLGRLSPGWTSRHQTPPRRLTWEAAAVGGP